MSTPVQYNASNFNLISYILSTYYNLGRKSINTQRHLPNYLEPNNYSNCVDHYLGVGNWHFCGSLLVLPTVWTLMQANVRSIFCLAQFIRVSIILPNNVLRYELNIWLYCLVLVSSLLLHSNIISCFQGRRPELTEGCSYFSSFPLPFPPLLPPFPPLFLASLPLPFYSPHSPSPTSSPPLPSFPVPFPPLPLEVLLLLLLLYKEKIWVA